MIQYSGIAILYCEVCDTKWSYDGANLDVCLDRAKRDGWSFRSAEVRGVEVQTTTCPHCVRDGK